MSSTVRRGLRACGISALLLVWGAATSAANDRALEIPTLQPAIDLTGVNIGAYVPVARVAPFASNEQTQTLLSLPRAKESNFESPALRRSLIASFGVLQALDVHSTMKALSNGGREANPAMSAITSNRTAFVAVKAGAAAATAYLAERLAKNHPKRAVVLMTILNSAYVAVVAHNYRVARQ